MILFHKDQTDKTIKGKIRLNGSTAVTAGMLCVVTVLSSGRSHRAQESCLRMSWNSYEDMNTIQNR